LRAFFVKVHAARSLFAEPWKLIRRSGISPSGNTKSP